VVTLAVDRGSRAALAAAAAALAAGALASLWLGQDANWDLRNYHYYDGWALARGTVDRSLWPAQLQSFLNPVLPWLAYVLVTGLPPWGAAALFAALQGTAFLALAILAAQLFGGGRERPGRAVAIAAALLIGASGPMVQAELGTSFEDGLTAGLVLGSLAALGRSRRTGSRRLILAAGTAAGLAVGLKMTNGCYAVGLLACGWWWGGAARQWAARLALFGAGLAFGFLLADGGWAWHLWATTGNPLFPFMNQVFHSPWAAAESFRDRRFLPGSLLDALSYPLQWSLGRHPTAESSFRDAAFALAWLLLPFGLWALWRRRGPQAADAVDGGWLRVILLFWASSFCAWIAMFAIQRYLCALELLNGIVIVGIIQSAPALRRPRLRALASVAAALLLLATSRSEGWGRLPWGEDWFGVELPPALQRPGQMFVVMSTGPVAYVIPFFPADARFVRVEGNLPLLPGTRLYDAARAAIAAHRGPLASLGDTALRPESAGLLAQFGLAPGPGPCVVLHTRMDRLFSCPLVPLR